jgi:hypothetical protein
MLSIVLWRKKNFIPEGALKKTFFPTHPPDHSNEFILIKINVIFNFKKW